MYAAFYFVNLYFTIVKRFDSDHAGINLLYYLPGLGGIYPQSPMLTTKADLK